MEIVIGNRIKTMNAMKKIKHIMMMAALAAVSLTGCSEKASYTPGEAENPDNYGVYFPEQTTSTTLEIDPKAETKVTYTVCRKRTDDAIIVPVTIETSTPDIFEISPIAFLPGKSETTFTVKFPKAEVGTKYSCTINVTDPDYVYVYGPRATSLTFSVVRAGWELVKGPAGETKGKWRDDIIGGLYSLSVSSFNPTPELDVEIYQRQDVPGIYRMKVYGGSKFIDAFTGGGYSFAENKDVWTTVNASNPDKVYLPLQTAGITFNSNDGELSFGSYVPENFSLDESAAQYGTLKDGVIEFPVQGILITISSISGYGYTNANGFTRILMPGVTVPDYSVTLSNTESKDGFVDVTATLSSDVAKVGYAVFEGALDSGEASLQAQELDLNQNFDGTIEKTSTLHLDCKKTGKYTLIGCVYSKEGSMQDYVSISFGYIAKGEEVPVVLNYGLEATNEYGAQGINSDNSAKFYAYGEDIESLTYGFYKSSYLEGKDLDEVLKDSGEDFTSAQLEAVNGTGFSSMIEDLNGDTEYTMVIKAFNGYTTSLTTATYKTTGVKNPGKEAYEYTDFKDEQPAKEELTSTEWNYYAISYKDKKQVRRRIGTVKITDYASDEEGYDYILIDGLSEFKFSEGGELLGAYMPNSSEFEGEKGAFALYCSYKTAIGTTEDGYSVNAGFIAKEAMQYVLSTFGMYFGEVADGYICGVAVPDFIIDGTQYTMDYLYFDTDTDYYLYSDILLVDPAKDMGGLPDAAVSNISNFKKSLASSLAPDNYVELPAKTYSPKLPRFAKRSANCALQLYPATAPEARRANVSVKAADNQSGNSSFVMKGLSR